MMKKILLMMGWLLVITGCGNKKEVDNLGIDFGIEGNEAEINYGDDLPVVAMEIENYGAIVIELYPAYAPNTVNNFISLVKKGFYDNNNFHRLMPGFVLQGGDPTGTGSGGPGYSIHGEFLDNKFYKNTLKHEEGIVSMARSTLPNSAGSQFFICLDTAANLDGSYAAFGKVIEGMEIIKDIEKKEIVADSESGKLQKNITIKKALVDTKGVEYPEVEKN